MATPALINKALLLEQRAISAAQAEVDAQTVSVTSGDVVVAADDTAYALTVEGGVITDVAVVTEPDAPTIGAATAGDEEAEVAFTPPVDDGGTPITGYTVVSTPGSIEAEGTESPITITGLTNDTEYTFKVFATNAVGDSALSAASNAVTPEAA